MNLTRLTFIIVGLVSFFSCTTKDTTTQTTQSEKQTTSSISLSDFLKNEYQSTNVDFDLVNKNLELFGTALKDPDAMTTTEVDTKLVKDGLEHFQQKEYKDCTSNVAQITLSAPLFATAQYVNAYSFFKQHRLEKAAEIFGGIFQYEVMHKELNREEVGWMNVYTQYLMYQKNDSDTQKKALDNAIDLFLKNINNSEGVFYNKVLTLKGLL